MPSAPRLFAAAVLLLAALGSSSPASALSLAPLPDVSAAALGDEHGCAISRGQVWCWGRNREGQLGDGSRSDRSRAVQVVDLPVAATAIAVGGRHSCALGGGQLYCWGDNTFGQLGTHDRVSRSRPVRVFVGGVTAARNNLLGLALGHSHSCASEERTVYCWGLNTSGQTGQPALTPADDDQDPASRAQPAPQLALDFAERGIEGAVGGLALGRNMSCAYGQEQVFCWGRNEVGQLGDGGFAARHDPAPVADLAGPFSALAVGGDEHVCAALQAGGVACWGNNYAGQVGVEPDPQRPETQPVNRPLLHPAISEVLSGLALGYGNSCAAISQEVRCWGNHPLDPVQRSAQPARLFALDKPIVALAGASVAQCALADGELACVGYTSQLGLGLPTGPLEALPVVGLPTPEHAQPLQLGGEFGCRRERDGVKCWGDNRYGQLGQGDRDAYHGAVAVLGSGGFVSLAVGRRHACAVDLWRSLWCWGDNTSGALGTGDLAEPSLPVRSSMPSGRSVVAGDGFTCSYEPMGGRGVHCWGNNRYGQVGLPASETPVLQAHRVELPDVVFKLVAGHRHVCAEIFGMPANRLFCWGQLNTGPEHLAGTLALREVDGLSAPISSAYTVCARDQAGQWVCFGHDYSDPGDSERGADRPPHPIELPVDAEGRAFDAALALGGRHLCAASVAGEVRCIGLPGQACQYGRATGAIATPGQGIGCSFSESMLSAAERDWIRIEGLPQLPVLQLGAGDQHACTSMGRQTYCWGWNDHGQLGTTVPWLQAEPQPVRREGALEPAGRLPVSVEPAQSCPGYFVGSVSLLEPEDGRAPGAWGQEILLTEGARKLHGGLNFGGYGSADVNPQVPGYAAFSLQSEDGRGQRVQLGLRGDGARFLLEVQSLLPPDYQRQTILQEEVELGDVEMSRAFDLVDGFHVIILQPLAGERLFLASARTTTLDGGPAAFQGGAVVGGFLRGAQSGFAALCTDRDQELAFRTEARGERGPSGAGDLRLKILNGLSGALLFDSASADP